MFSGSSEQAGEVIGPGVNICALWRRLRPQRLWGCVHQSRLEDSLPVLRPGAPAPTLTVMCREGWVSSEALAQTGRWYSLKQVSGFSCHPYSGFASHPRRLVLASGLIAELSPLGTTFPQRPEPQDPDWLFSSVGSISTSLERKPPLLNIRSPRASALGSPLWCSFDTRLFSSLMHCDL